MSPFGESGQCADLGNRSFLTLNGLPPPSIAALRKVHSVTSLAMESTGPRKYLSTVSVSESSLHCDQDCQSVAQCLERVAKNRKM